MSKLINEETKGAKYCADMVNNYGFSEQLFCEAMNREHRYLQFRFTELCIEWLKYCSSSDYQFDGRNEWNHLVGEKVVRALKEKRII